MQSIFGPKSNCKLVRHDVNSGVSAGILTGIRAADHETVASMDCDCSYDPLELKRMLPLLSDDVDLVTASPYNPDGKVKNVPGWRLLLSKGLSQMYRCVLPMRLHTWTSCFRVYRKSVVDELPLIENGFLGTAEMVAQLSEMKLEGNTLYLGSDSSNPQIGDTRIEFVATKPADVSIVAQQAGNSLQAYQTKAGQSLDMLRMGKHSADEMFAMAKADNDMMTWIFRGVGTVVMFIGLIMLTKPISVLADIIPFLGGFVEMDMALLAGLITIALSAATIGFAWLFFRPLIGVPLLVVSLGAIVLLFMKRSGGRSARSVGGRRLRPHRTTNSPMVSNLQRAVFLPTRSSARFDVSSRGHRPAPSETDTGAGSEPCPCRLRRCGCRHFAALAVFRRRSR